MLVAFSFCAKCPPSIMKTYKFDGERSRASRSFRTNSIASCASSVSTNYGTPTEHSSASSSSPTRNVTSSLGTAPKEPATTVSLLAARLTNAPSAQASRGVKNFSRAKKKSRAQTSRCFRFRARQGQANILARVIFQSVDGFA
jgi:hypothetical protein